MKIKRSVLGPLAVAGFALATGGWFLQRGVNHEQNVYVQAKLFEEVLHQVADRFVDRKEPSQLYRMAIDGMLEELGDPHTAVMSQNEYAQLRLQTSGEYGGLGMQVGKRGDWITVIAPLPGTPAERAGIQAGDQIIEIDGKSTKGLTEDEAVQRLRGPKGSSVELKLVRYNPDQPLTVKLVRAEIHVNSVPAAYMVEPGIGYVELVTFSESSTEELRGAIQKLRSQGAKSIVLDLRRNPGGLLDAGVNVSDLFLNKGQVVVETKGRIASQNQVATATGSDRFPGMPLVVLVGGGSASASEIVAGALQDHDRALVIGRTTYGKGSVQQLFPLSNDQFLKMTTARWYTPVGRSIQKPYGIDASHANGNNGSDGAAADQSTTESNDSTKKPAYKTDSGRTVYGGGGIHPDVVVLDTLTAGERVLVDVLQSNYAKYLDQRFTFAVKYMREHPELKPGFPVTKQMLGAFYDALTRAGVTIERPVYDAAERWVATGLGYEMTYTKWGEQEARKRLNSESPELRVATELLRKAKSPGSLFNLADAYNAQHATTTAAAPKNNDQQR